MNITSGWTIAVIAVVALVQPATPRAQFDCTITKVVITNVPEPGTSVRLKERLIFWIDDADKSLMFADGARLRVTPAGHFPNGQIKLDENRQAIGTVFVTEVVKDKDGNLVNKVVQVVPNAWPPEKRFTSPSFCAVNYYDETTAALLALDKVNGDLSDGHKKFREALASLVLDAPIPIPSMSVHPMPSERASVFGRPPTPPRVRASPHPEGRLFASIGASR
jgi:hypothetical protein